MKGPIASAATVAPVSEMKNSGNANENLLVDILVNPIHAIQIALEKKLRNLGKRMQKLRQIKLDQANGTRLSEEQCEAISKAGEVDLQIEFIRDLQKLMEQQLRQYQRATRQKESATLKKTENDGIKLLGETLKYQEALNFLVGHHLENGTNCLALSEEESIAFNKLHLTCSVTTTSGSGSSVWGDQANCVARKMNAIVGGSGTEVVDGLTGARAKALLDQLMANSSLQSADKESKKVQGPTAELKQGYEESDESSLNDFRQGSVDSSAADSNPKREQDQETDNEQEKLGAKPASSDENGHDLQESQHPADSGDTINNLSAQAMGNEDETTPKEPTEAKEHSLKPEANTQHSTRPHRGPNPNNYRFRRERLPQLHDKSGTKDERNDAPADNAKNLSSTHQQQNQRPRHSNSKTGNYCNNSGTQRHRGSFSGSASSNTTSEKQRLPKGQIGVPAHTGPTAQAQRPCFRKHDYDGNAGQQRGHVREFRGGEQQQQYGRGATGGDQYSRDGGSGYHNRDSQPQQPQPKRTHQPYECGLKFAY